MLRKLAGLKRDELAMAANVSSASISYWENASLSELSHKGADKIIKAMQDQGIEVTVEWLLFGIGASPYIRERQHAPAVHSFLCQETTLQQEIALFQTNPNSCVLEIVSTPLIPFIGIGDFVGGLWQSAAVCQHQEYFAIVEVDNVLQLGSIVKQTNENGYHIRFAEPIAEKPEIKLSEIKKIAPVIRVWKQQQDR